MSLTNYSDISRAGSDVDAGFQFQFSCGNCSRTWKSTFKPYRRGQLSGLIYKFAYYIDRHGSLSRMSTALSESGMKRARDAALQEALVVAEQRYHVCPGCEKAVCESCWDTGGQRCEGCITHGRRSPQSSDRESASSSAAPRASCPNCKAALDGGRFCAECGFDMASTHKSCPGCGTMCTRAARFCTDCGHGF